VCLAYTPDVKVGEYVIVHVGFAIGTVSEEEAQEVFKTLEAMGELGELDTPQPE
jgi:hydrogenase expression/formation protein HypC